MTVIVAVCFSLFSRLHVHGIALELNKFETYNDSIYFSMALIVLFDCLLELNNYIA